jgi:hypothetical protein
MTAHQMKANSKLASAATIVALTCSAVTVFAATNATEYAPSLPDPTADKALSEVAANPHNS